MHLNIIIRDGQKQLGIIEVQTFESDLYVAQLALNKPGTMDDDFDDGNSETRVALALDASEIDGLIAALQSARKNIKKARTI